MNLARVSMYRLVALALALILAVAIALAGMDALTLSAGSIAATAAAATAGSLAGTYLPVLVLRLPAPHALSPVITGLILGLVLQPVLGWALLGAAATGLLAGLSKYLLAWRGRHVFNPAAIGLVLAGWFGWAHSWWWVGSQALFVVVVVLGAVVLWRTKRFGYAASFAVVAGALTALGYVMLGTPSLVAVVFAVVSGPLVFFAAFMLTEPLTAPPRGWQRVAVGALIGALTAAPVLFGWGWLSPELALVIGNAVAFALGLRGGVRLRLVGRDMVASDAGELLDLRFAPSTPLRFRPGQYVEIDVPQADALGASGDVRGRRRVLSVASSPRGPEVRLLTRVGGDVGVTGASPVKRALAALEPGEEVAVTLVAGDFLLRPRSALLGAGIGMTPFLAMLDDAARGGDAGDVVAVWLVRDARDLVPVLGPDSGDLPAGVRLVVVVPPGSQVPDGALPAGAEVLVGSSVDPGVLAEAVPDLAERTVLVSGSPAAVAQLRVAAREAGARRITTDVFLGY